MKNYGLTLLFMLVLFAVTGCEDEKVSNDLGITDVVLPDLSESSLGTEITIQGHGFQKDDVLALSAVSGGAEEPIYLETRDVTADHIVVFYPSTAVSDSYGLTLVRGNRLKALGVLSSVAGTMPDENLRKALSGMFPNIFREEKILSSAKRVSFPDGLLDISGKNIGSLEGLQYFQGITQLVCSNNSFTAIPAETLYRLTALTAQNTGLTSLKPGTVDRPNTTLSTINIDGCAQLDSVDLYYSYAMEQFSAQKCNLIYLDVRNFHSIWGGILNYNGNDYRFSFSDDQTKERRLKMESWWMDSYYYAFGPIVDAIEKGVIVEGYDWVHNYPNGEGKPYYSNGNYQKTMTRAAEIPDANLRSALKALVPDVFEGDKVLTVKALNSDYFKNHQTLDLSNRNIKNLEGLQYFCGYKHLVLDGNDLGDFTLSKYAISTAYTAGPVDEKGIESISLKNAGLTKFVSGDQYMISWIDVSGNPALTYIDVSRSKGLAYFNASGCPLTYLDLRNLAGDYSILAYVGGNVDATKAVFSFTNSTAVARKLLVEDWWMNSPWINGVNACNTAKDQGVRVEMYKYEGYEKNVMTGSFN